jgi:hypothetical protein
MLFFFFISYNLKHNESLTHVMSLVTRIANTKM